MNEQDFYFESAESELQLSIFSSLLFYRFIYQVKYFFFIFIFELLFQI